MFKSGLCPLTLNFLRYGRHKITIYVLSRTLKHNFGLQTYICEVNKFNESNSKFVDDHLGIEDGGHGTSVYFHSFAKSSRSLYSPVFEDHLKFPKYV